MLLLSHYINLVCTHHNLYHAKIGTFQCCPPDGLSFGDQIYYPILTLHQNHMLYNVLTSCVTIDR